MSDAKTKIVIDVGEGAKSLRTLKQEFKEGQKELEGLTVGTKEYIAQIKKLGAVKDEIEDLNKEIAAFRPDQKLGAFVGAAKGIAAGFEAATAASALFGDKAEDVEKTLLKVQSAMALANAVQEVGELGKAFQLLGSVIKSAIGSTGIGLLVVAIGAIAANWERIKSAVSGVNKEQEENLALATEAVNKGKERLDHLDIEEKKWKLMGMSEEQILINKQKEFVVQQALLKTQLEAQLNISLSQEKAAERNKEILKGILKFTTAPLQALISGIDYIAEKVSGKKLIDVDLADKLANVIFDPEEARKKTEEIKETYKKGAEDLQKQELDLQLGLKSIRDAAHKKQLEDIDKRHKELQEKIKQNFDIEKQQQEENGDDSIARWKRQKDEEKRIQDEAEAEKTRIAKYRSDQRKAIQEAELSVATSVVSSLGSLAEILGNQGQEMQNFQKGLAVTQIAIDTAKAISGAVAQAQSVPFPGNIVAIATGVATVLANIAKAKQLLESTGASTPSLNISSASSGGAIRPPSLNQVGSTATNLDKLQGNNQNTQPVVKAVVVETDITSSQKRINKITDKTKH